MQSSLPILSVVESYLEKSNPSVKELIIEVCERLDIEGLELLIQDDAVFDNKSKWKFLSQFRDMFKRIKQEGFYKLEHGYSNCNHCRKGNEVVYFKNSKGGIHWGFVFEELDGEVKNIYMCSSFKGYFRSLIPSQSTPYAEKFYYPKE